MTKGKELLMLRAKEQQQGNVSRIGRRVVGVRLRKWTVCFNRVARGQKGVVLRP